MRNILSEKVIETMKRSPGLFRSIMPPKIFTDMYQFYQSQSSMTAQGLQTRRGSQITEKDPGTTTLSMDPKLTDQNLDFKNEETYSPTAA